MKKVFSTRFLVIFFTLLLVGQLIWNAYLYGLDGNTNPANYWYNFAYGSTSVLIAIVGFLSVYLGKERKTAVSRAVAFMSWGSLANGLGLYYWGYNNLVNNIAIPYPSMGEYLFIIFPILIGIGFWTLLSLYKPLISWRLVVEALVVTVISAALIFRSFIIPNLDPSLSFFSNFVTIMIPWEDAFIIALVYVALRLSGGRFHGYFWLFITSLLLLIAGDFVFQYRNLVGLYWNGDIADLLYTLNMYVFALALIFTIDSSTKTLVSAAPLSPTPTPASPPAAMPPPAS